MSRKARMAFIKTVVMRMEVGVVTTPTPRKVAVSVDCRNSKA
jgi:hypothetical protein